MSSPKAQSGDRLLGSVGLVVVFSVFFWSFFFPPSCQVGHFLQNFHCHVFSLRRQSFPRRSGNVHVFFFGGGWENGRTLFCLVRKIHENLGVKLSLNIQWHIRCSMMWTYVRCKIPPHWPVVYWSKRIPTNLTFNRVTHIPIFTFHGLPITCQFCWLTC